MLTLGHKVLLHLGTNCKLHRDDSERIMYTEYIMFTGWASSKLSRIIQKAHLFKSSSAFEEYCACSTTTGREHYKLSGALEN